MKKLLLLSAILLSFVSLKSQALWQQETHMHGDHACNHESCGLEALNQVMNTHVGPPANFVPGAERAVVINVNYNGFSPAAQAAFQHAVDIWSSQLTSGVPINVNANWTVLGANTLGSAGPTLLFRDFGGAPFASTWYSVALANSINGSDLDGASVDIDCNFNSNFANWYLGIDGNCPPGSYDFVTVVLHELCHGLGFIGLAGYTAPNGSLGLGGFNSIYERFVENGAGSDITSFANPGATLGSALTGNDLWWWGPNGSAPIGTRPRIYAPANWAPGSSYSHLDESAFPAGDPNSLMTYALGTGEVVHNPGPVVLGMFEDMGWAMGVIPGCMDPNACNYDPNATSDDGSCDYNAQWYIPNDVAAANTPLILSCSPVANYTLSPYQSCVQAVVDMDPYCVNTDWDNICVNEYNALIGCTAIDACNYEFGALCDDGSCTFPGCNDPGALNYNPGAGCNDGSCIYPPSNDACSGAIEVFNGSSSFIDNSLAADNGPDPTCGGTGIVDLWYSYTSVSGGILNVSTVLNGTMSDSRLAIYDACGGTELACNDDSGGLASSVSIATSCGVTYYIQFGGYNAITGSATMNVNETISYGCSDPNACNFDVSNPCAIDACTYPGCNDPAACNYDASAACDDGSCYGNIPATGVVNACVFDNNGDCIVDGDLCSSYSYFGFGTSVSTMVNADRILGINLSLSRTSCQGSTMSVSINGVVGYTQFSNACLCEGPTFINLSGAQLQGQISGNNTIEVSWDGEVYLSSVIMDITVGELTYGCTDPSACNYSGACVDDGSCTYPGCNDPGACNFNPGAGCNDGSCTYPGCTDAAACNYNAGAGCDDGSCATPDCAGVCGGTAIVDDCGNCIPATACSHQEVFAFTGTEQTFTVPGGVTEITVTAAGGQGGSQGGLGAQITGTFAVTPGEILNLVVGGEGLEPIGTAQNSAGGGGGSFVYNSSNTLLIAAGGGGGKCNYAFSVPLHPEANGQAGQDGGANSAGNAGGTAGLGGSEGFEFGIIMSGGGAGWLGNGCCTYGGQGFGSWNGGPGLCEGGGAPGCGGIGAFGGGGGGGNWYGGGGGGGGYSGGAGGADPDHGGGGGSFNGGTNQVNTGGVQAGDGLVIISYNMELFITDCDAGCNDPNALNYDANANFDDGSCIYLDECGNVINAGGDGVGFVAEFAAANWTIDTTTGDGSVSINSNTLTVIGTDQGGIGLVSTNATTTAPATGNYSFDWNYATNDFGPYYDPAFYINGTLVQLTFDNGNPEPVGLVQNGSVSFAANAGDVIGFAVNSVDGCCGEATLVVSNFTYPVSCVFGCTDVNACNYDPAATECDNSCTYAIAYYLDCNGLCLNDADNDGVCDELEVTGCTDPSAINYNANITEEDGSCLYAGCTDAMALNYDMNANFNDGSCTYLAGCTYPDANNYNASAIVDDGSCVFPAGPNTCPEDIDGNGQVNTGDLLQLLASFGTVCP